MKEYLCTNWGKTVLTRWFFQLLTVASIVGWSFPVKATPNVWINEIHYDNDNTDVNEGIEVAGPSGTDLDGFTLVFYNGSNGEAYKTVSLTGIVPNQNNSFGTVAFAVSGIQNGGPDGIALVDDSSMVVQFLSYEGAFTAVGGPADGIMSTDILVSETTSPIGESLQLVGTGSSYGDFTWSGPSADSFDSVNTGQQFPEGEPPPPPPSNSVPDGGSSCAMLGITFLGLMYRLSCRQGGGPYLR